LNNHANAEDVEKPLTSVLAGGQHHALCQPIIIDHFKNGEAKSADEPIGAQTTHDRYSVAIPFIVTNQSNNAPRGIDKPIRAQTTVGKDYLCTPLILGQQGGAACRPIDEPCPTIATAGAIRVVTPIILDMSRPGGHDSGHVRSADMPIQTITTCDSVQVATPIIFDKAVGLPRLPDGRYIDIYLRMLKPSELAKAHSFPDDYHLTGNRGEQVKQIGNSVPVRTAAAMCEVEFMEVQGERVA
jgi:DNA (cytosine-5)-methyltransferase 1